MIPAVCGCGFGSTTYKLAAYVYLRYYDFTKLCARLRLLLREPSWPCWCERLAWLLPHMPRVLNVHSPHFKRQDPCAEMARFAAVRRTYQAARGGGLHRHLHALRRDL